jgi:hypothetical protein
MSVMKFNLYCFFKLLLLTIYFVFNYGCKIREKSNLEKLVTLNDTTYLSERELANLSIGFKSYLNLISDSSFLRIRIASNYSDSTEYFEFVGKDIFYSVKQKYVDIMDLGYRDSLIVMANDLNNSVFFECLKTEKILYLFFKEKVDLSTYTDSDATEFIFEGYRRGHYFRKVFYSELFNVSNDQKLVQNLLTIANVQSGILNINIPELPKEINADEEALLKPIN